MNLLHLRYFYVVAVERSFSRASQTLKVDQSALSRMVKQYEENLGVNLLERQPRGVALTDAGQRVFKRAEEIFSQVQLIEEESRENDLNCRGELVLATTDLLADRIVPQITEKLMRQWPLLHPTVHVGSATDMIPNLVGGRTELGLFFHIPKLPHSLAVTRRWSLRFHLVCAKAQAKNRETLQRFIGSREVDDRLNREFPTISKWKKIVPDAYIAASSNSLLFHFELVRRGLGISVLPRFLIEKSLVRGDLIDLMPQERLEFDLKLIQRKNMSLTQNAKVFIGHFDKKFER